MLALEASLCHLWKHVFATSGGMFLPPLEALALVSSDELWMLSTRVVPIVVGYFLAYQQQWQESEDDSQITSKVVSEGDNPLDFALPLVILQICLVVVFTRVLALLLRPLRQPRVIAEIITQGPFRQSGKKILCIAIAGISLPFALGIGSSFVLRATTSKGVSEGPFLVFMGVALSITAFPVLARILSELKLLTTDVGRMAMSAAALNDVAAWILLAVAIAISGTGHSPVISLWVFLCGCGFVICCIFIVLPIFKWMAQCCPEGEPVDEMYVCATWAAVLAAGFVTDAIVIHALFGAFVLGAIMPKDGPFANALVEKVEDLASGPVPSIVLCVKRIEDKCRHHSGASVMGPPCFGHMYSLCREDCWHNCSLTLVQSAFSGSSCSGVLMNSKGLVELIVLNIGKDRAVLNDQMFAIMVLMALFTTFITTPLVIAVYKPAKRTSRAEYKHRTIQRKYPNTQVRMLACFHSTRNIPTLIDFIEASCATDKREGLCVYAMHLMELSERSSAILMVHKARKNGLPFWNKGQQSHTNQIVVAFEAFQRPSRVSIQPMTAISPMSSMHEDICSSADSKRVAMIILPFHKHQRLDGQLETTRTDFRYVNWRVLEHAPCSVGILVDRGLGGTTHITASNVRSVITVLFFGGHDDREALAYGMHMAEHPGVNLVVIRFIVDPNVAGEIVKLDMDNSNTVERSEDEEFLAECKEKILEDSTIKYEERVVSSAAETVEAIRSCSLCNLFLVGRMPEGQLVAALRGN
ncbi:hypothetical protein F0562_011588 [Nyssa sinensis]|uniref:Uncharacterized protein n=1 Tax=Nyssa sinensis TaxID=561372 RepID=A0A5J4ZQD9_9ASTE|nr:hypothetical protein F0562_011588 [Nyssa sinensis]